MEQGTCVGLADMYPFREDVLKEDIAVDRKKSEDTAKTGFNSDVDPRCYPGRGVVEAGTAV